MCRLRSRGNRLRIFWITFFYLLRSYRICVVSGCGAGFIANAVNFKPAFRADLAEEGGGADYAVERAVFAFEKDLWINWG